MSNHRLTFLPHNVHEHKVITSHINQLACPSRKVHDTSALDQLISLDSHPHYQISSKKLDNHDQSHHLTIYQC